MTFHSHINVPTTTFYYSQKARFFVDNHSLQYNSINFPNKYPFLLYNVHKNAQSITINLLRNAQTHRLPFSVRGASPTVTKIHFIRKSNKNHVQCESGKKKTRYLFIDQCVTNILVLFEGGNERVSMTRHFHFNYDCYIGTQAKQSKKFIIIIIIYYKLIFTQQFSRYSIEIEYAFVQEKCLCLYLNVILVHVITKIPDVSNQFRDHCQEFNKKTQIPILTLNVSSVVLRRKSSQAKLRLWRFANINSQSQMVVGLRMKSTLD